MARPIVRGLAAVLLLGVAACTGSHSGTGAGSATGAGGRVTHELRFRQVIAGLATSSQAHTQAAASVQASPLASIPAGASVEASPSAPAATAMPTGAGPPCSTVNTKVSGACVTPLVTAEIARLGTCSHPVPLTEPNSLDDPAQPQAACARDGNVLYLLAPSFMTGADIKEATSVDDATEGWLVQLTFTDKGTEDFGKLTGAVTSQRSPLNQIAVVLDGVVQSAPEIQEAVTGGEAQITGGEKGLTQADTDRLAAELNQRSDS